MMKFVLRNYDTLKAGILLLLVFFLPYYHSVASILIIAALLLTVVKLVSVDGLRVVKFDLFPLLLVFYFLFEVIGLIYTDRENLDVGLFNLQKHLSFLVFPLIFFDININNGFRKKLLGLFTISCLVGTLVCVGVNIYISLRDYNTIFHEWRFSHARLSEPIGMHPVYFAMYIGLCILILLQYICDKMGSIAVGKTILLIFAILYFLLIIVSLGARTIIVTLMGLILANLVFYAISHRSWKFLAIAFLIPLIFGGYVWLNPIVQTRFVDMMKDRYENSNYGSYFARTRIWEPGIELVKETFWFGVGTGDDQVELDKKYVKYDYPEAIGALNMHNQYLQTLLGTGLIGLLILLSIFVIQLRRAFADKDLLYISFVFLFMFGCLTESMLCRQQGIIFFILFSFIFFIYSRRLDVDPSI